VSGNFEDLVDLTGLSDEDETRLRRVHEMLVAAGPPTDLPIELSRPVAVADGEVVSLAEVVPLADVIPLAQHRSRRRPVAALLIAATVAVACFGGGYLLATQASSDKSAIKVVRVVPMQGVQEQNSLASLSVGSSDQNGNWPLQLTVSGLPQLTGDARYYLVVKQGKGGRGILCGSFEVAPHGATTVTFNVAYKITPSTHWIITRMAPGVKYPGHVVMTTS
jgi:hypothetical protein